MALSAGRAIALGALVVAGSVLGLAAPALAHNYLVSSTPSEGETLTELPAEFSVTTNGPLLVLDGATEGFAMEIVDSEGLYYGDGCVTVDGPTMSEAAALGEAGDYRMLWQLVSADGHTVSGEIGFTWAPPAGFKPTTGAAAPSLCGVAGEGASTSPPVVRENADLGDVLWIGGAVAAVLVAALVTFLVMTRKKRG